MSLVKALLVALPLVAQCTTWWERPWQYQSLNVSVGEGSHSVQVRRVGKGAQKVLAVQGGPGAEYWDLNFLAVYLDLDRFEVIQYNPLGASPSDCSRSEEPCAQDPSWMNLGAFVSMMDKVYSAMQLPSDTIIVGHSFGVVCSLEFMLRWPQRAAGLVLSDWVPSQEQAAQRSAWCEAQGVGACRYFNQSLREPWYHDFHKNKVLTEAIWGPAGALQGWDVRDRLAELRHIPSLSIVGEKDLVFPQDVQQMSLALGGEYAFLPAAGHHSFVDKRDEWLEAFVNWAGRLRMARSLSLGCGSAAPPPDQRGAAPFPQTIAGRQYHMSLPEGYSPERPHSLILSFHGLDSPVEHAPLYGPVPGAWGNTIMAFPVGLRDAVLVGAHASTWNGSGSVGSPGPRGMTCRPQTVIEQKIVTRCPESCMAMGGCGDPCWLTTCADDVSFVANILEDLKSRFCVNIDSVHAMGFSGGGWFALELGTNPHTAHHFKSIVSFAGLPFRGFNKPPGMREGARFVGIYGRQDHTIPGFPNTEDPTMSVSIHGFLFSTWKNTTSLWAKTFGCGGLLSSSKLRPDFSGLECMDYDCTRGSVSVCLWDGQHEVVPGALSVVTQTMFPETIATYGAGPMLQTVDLSSTLLMSCILGSGLLLLAAARLSSGRSKQSLGMPLLPTP